MFRFNTRKLNTDIVLGCGSNSKIYPYHKFPNDDRWAVKYLIAQGFDDLLKIMQEIVIGFSCDHPSILPIKGYYIAPAEPTGWDVYIKLPRMQGTLAHFLERRRANGDFVPKENVIKYFYSLACGLEYLHNRKIAHRDIKPANILFDKEGKIKLGDVGVAKFIPEEELGYFRTDKAGTEFYIAPELQNDKGPNPKLMKKDFFKADSWSLGVVMAEICTLNIAQTNSNALQKNDAKTYLQDFFATRYNDPVLLKLIIDLLHAEDPSQRISVGQARKTLEATYPDILGLKEKEIDPDLKFIKTELAKTWDKTFKFETDKTFAVQGKSINWIDDGKVRDFIKDLGKDIKGKKIENLKTFELNLECCANITDQTTEIISLGLESSLKRLEELSLNFVGCNHITNRGVHTLSVSIGSNLTALQSLSLDFGWCKEITDEGIRSLKDCIAKLNNLQDLSLSLRSCEKITDYAVEELATGIEHAHDNLESLGLNFWGCEKITDQAIEFIQKSIGRQFHSCNKISDGAARKLSNHIQSSLRRLDYISLNFIGCHEITLQTQTIMIKSLKKAISQCELLFDIPK